MDDFQSRVEEGNYELLQQYSSTIHTLVQDAVGISSTLVSCRASPSFMILLSLPV